MNTKRHIIIITFLLWTTFLFGQTSYINTECKSQFDSISNRIIYPLVDTMPEFPGGNDSLMGFIVTNIRYPLSEIKCTGTVYVSFIVEVDGKLTNIQIYRGLCAPYDDEVLRVIKIMPKWKSGKCKEKFVPVKYILPIKFTIP